MGSGTESLPRKIRWFVYLSHALSTWGDRMWSFGVGLFMVIISPESLRVTAIYGLSMGGAILLFGALVGDWVDKTPRLTAARTTLIIQNTSVIVCAAIVYTVITLKPQIQEAWPNEGLLTLCYAIIILVAIVSTLAGMGTNIAVQKDWVVEICHRDKNMLATMTATLRRIDLFNSLVAPIATGQIMFYASTGIGALFIAGWNLVSVFVEYILLWKVYSLVPALRGKKGDKSANEEENAEEMVSFNKPGDDLDIEVKGEGQTEGDPQGHDESSANLLESKKSSIEVVDDSHEDKGSKQESNIESISKEKGSARLHREDKTKGSKGNTDSNVKRMFSGILILYRGWRTYMKYDVAFAGLGLACLYMTVLGFDNITVGYAYSQGINESIMGILMAAGAISGILGTLLYPLFRKKIGLERTGLFSFFFEISFLCLCVASVWSPGSPFDPFSKNKSLCNNKSVLHSNQSLSTSFVPLEVSNNVKNLTKFNETGAFNDKGSQKIGNISDFIAYGGNRSIPNDTGSDVTGCAEESRSFISVGLLMAGIIGARCGLWMADLTISQLLLENIRENERGIVNGVQTSLNKLMDILKFILVIATPQEGLFGFLILVSFGFICLGWASYAKYSHGVRGHLLHRCSDKKNNNVEGENSVPDEN